MDRRTFLATMQGVLAAAAVPTVRAEEVDPWKVAFEAALERKPWLSGYRSAANDALRAEVPWKGNVGNLEGVLYRNGPAGHDVGPFRYRHWFDGDGMVQRFAVFNRGVSHLGRFVETRKRKAELSAGRPLYPTFGSSVPNPAPVGSADALNPANISTLIHGGEVFALWEAGSAHKLDPESLETLGLHTFSPETKGLPFSAHPRVEADGTLWNFGYVTAARRLVLWHVAPSGELRNVGLVPVDPITMVHDFVVTKKHLVFLLPPLDHRAEGGSTFLHAHKWQPDAATRVLVVDKNDFSNITWLELPAQWVFHFGNAWEDNAGIIRFDAARAPDPSLMFGRLRTIMRGDETGGGKPASHYRYTLDLKKGVAREEALLAERESSEFPAIDPRISGRRYRRVLTLTNDQGRNTEHGHFNAVMLMNVDNGKAVRFTYPDDVIAEEHIIVPKAGKPEEDIWIVGTSLAYREGSTHLSVFDGRDLSSGPVAVAKLPYALPLGLHGKWRDLS